MFAAVEGDDMRQHLSVHPNLNMYKKTPKILCKYNVLEFFILKRYCNKLDLE